MNPLSSKLIVAFSATTHSSPFGLGLFIPAEPDAAS